MPGALATTDAEGSDGSEAGVGRPAGVRVVEGGTASCGCLEQAASVKSSADDKRSEADFICRLSKTRTVLRSRGRGVADSVVRTDPSCEARRLSFGDCVR